MGNASLRDRIYASLLGGLIGDAMGAPVENWTYQAIEQKYGVLDTFAGAGTDDSAVKLIICEALLENGGHITADELAASFLKNEKYYNLFYIPVRNMFHKIKDELSAPIDAGYGNMQSSSSAMAISPMGLINACDPRRAARETFEVATLIHSGPASFCRDGACVMAAAVAQAMVPDATVDEVCEAAVKYLHPTSGALLKGIICEVMDLARLTGDYRAFREAFYEKYLQNVICDSRETIPATLAIFYLSGGDPEKCIINGANFGRDADTIASMVGAIAGAFRGLDGLRPEWVSQIEAEGDFQRSLADRLCALVRSRTDEDRARIGMLDSM